MPVDANTKVVNQAVAALVATNSAATPTTAATWRTDLLPGSAVSGAPFLKSWPRSTLYVISVAGKDARQDNGDALFPQR